FLLVGIDTESDNQWDAAARARPTFENIYALPRLHACFQRHSVRPTYLVTHPVAVERRSADVLRQLSRAGDCEIGAHHHAWETPPCAPEDAGRHQYALQLSLDRFEAQLTHLSDAVGSVSGRRPRSYRSGRFGFGARHVSSLERAGFRIESSIAPLFYEAHKGGPDFVDAPLRPYFLSYDDAVRPGTSDLLELPLSVALNRRLPRWLERLYGRAPKPYTTKRILRLLGLLKPIWLRPSYSSLDEMKRLARALKMSGVPLLNVLFHSSEAIVGGSPYNRTDSELQASTERLDRFLAYATGELGAQPATFSEFKARWCVPERPARADQPRDAHLSRHPSPAA
ncbi:MAG: hypothetical protein HYZ58_11245, partial [Acidobacteria bacterium]|nr:hypothetical protein [Acidobacteriota bacterium]